MQDTKTRLVALLAELLWVATVMLLCAAGVYQADGAFAMWGLASSAAAAAATVSAVVMCAAGKVLRAQLRDEITSDVAEYLRRQD